MKVGVVGFKIVLTLRAGLSSAGNAKAQWVFQTSWILFKVKLLQPLLKLGTLKPSLVKELSTQKFIKWLELRNTDMLMRWFVRAWSPVCKPRPCRSCRINGDVFCPVSSLL